jgi:hypothetical protein
VRAQSSAPDPGQTLAIRVARGTRTALTAPLTHAQDARDAAGRGDAAAQSMM